MGKNYNHKNLESRLEKQKVEESPNAQKILTYSLFFRQIIFSSIKFFRLNQELKEELFIETKKIL